MSSILYNNIIMYEIFTHLKYKNLMKLKRVCKKFKSCVMEYHKHVKKYSAKDLDGCPKFIISELIMICKYDLPT